MSDGGPAFPRTGEGFGDPRYDVPGMSLLQWYAGMALMGMCANPDCEPEDARHNAIVAFRNAYEMIQQQENERTQTP